MSGLSTDLQQIGETYDPQISQERGVAEKYDTAAVASAEKASDIEMEAAHAITGDEAKLDEWLKNTPTEQASYATAMHAAPVLSVLTALGGRMTRLTGMQMLSAQTGILQGLNTAAQSKYEDAYRQWMAGYQRLKDHQETLMKYYELMLGAYTGKADAQQKAAEAARRMAGDLLDAKQTALSNRINLFKAQSEAISRLDRVQASLAALHERVREHLQQEAHWKVLEGKNIDPTKKMQLAQVKAEWQNLKAQVDEAMKQRGQINSNLDLSPEAKAAAQAQIDDRIAALEAGMNSAIARGDALVAAPVTNPEATQPAPGGAGGGGAIPPGTGRTGAIARPPGQAQPQGPQPNLSDKKMAWLKQHQGQQVTFQDGTVAIMAADGTVSVLKSPTLH